LTLALKSITSTNATASSASRIFDLSQQQLRRDAGDLVVNVPFALCVTLEVAAEAGIPIYEEIRTSISPAIQIQPNAL